MRATVDSSAGETGSASDGAVACEGDTSTEPCEPPTFSVPGADSVTGLEIRRPLAKRAVERAEVLDLDPSLDRAKGHVATRELRVLDRDVGVLAPDDELGLDRSNVRRPDRR